MTPNSPFSDPYKCATFAIYFKEQYQMNVVHQDQFMLDTKGITSSLNFLSAGAGQDGSMNKYSRNLSASEYYIPELVHNFKYSADYWLKGILLPSILHRLSYMLLAEKLRSTLNTALNLPTKVSRVMLDVDSRKNKINEKEEPPVVDSDSDSEYNENQAQTKVAPITYPKANEVPSIHLDHPLMQLTDQLNTLTLWNEDEEPLDIDRSWETIQEIELDYYVNFITKSFENMKVKQYAEYSGFIDNNVCPMEKKPKAIQDVPNDIKFDIHLLKRNVPEAPELKDVLRAITCTSSGDVFDLERFELLGDSFLKFSISLYLVYKHPEWHEGYLTTCKGTIVSNRNLFYLGKVIDLPGMLKLFPFDPKNSWAPPLFRVPDSVKDNMMEMRHSASDLNKLVISPDEFERGELDPRTELTFFGSIRGSGNRDLSDGPARLLLDQQNVSDKAVADSLESILGVYLHSAGIERTLQLLNFFQIVPDDQRLLPNMLRTRMQSVRVKAGATEMEVDELLINYKHLEKSLGYKFNDRSYLLQALLHPSYPGTRFDCYQRLEFVGDAILGNFYLFVLAFFLSHTFFLPQTS